MDRGPEARTAIMQESEPKQNKVIVSIDGVVVIKGDSPTLDGKFVDAKQHPYGTFRTENYGDLSIDLGEYKADNYTVIVQGEALKSKSRQALRKQSPASKGVRKIDTGGRAGGGQHLGKDHITGRIRTITVSFYH